MRMLLGTLVVVLALSCFGPSAAMAQTGLARAVAADKDDDKDGDKDGRRHRRHHHRHHRHHHHRHHKHADGDKDKDDTKKS